MKTSEKITYKETYKGVCVKEHLLPTTLPHLAEGTEIKRIDVKAAGKIVIDGDEFEFQDIRVICR